MWFTRQTEVDAVFIQVAALLLSWLFLSTAWHKLSRPGLFKGVIDSYRLLPFPAHLLHSVVLGIVEAAVGLGLLLALTRPWAGILSMALLAVYAAAIAINLLRGNSDLDCGCSGPFGSQPISWYLVGRNFVLIAIAGMTLFSPSLRTLNWLDWTTTGFAALLAVLAYHGAEVLVENQGKLNTLREQR